MIKEYKNIRHNIIADLLYMSRSLDGQIRYTTVKPFIEITSKTGMTYTLAYDLQDGYYQFCRNERVEWFMVEDDQEIKLTQSPEYTLI